MINDGSALVRGTGGISKKIDILHFFGYIEEALFVCNVHTYM